MLSHPTSHSKEITIRDFLVNEFNLPIKDDNQREGIVHRLDRVTSGLMVCVLDENILTCLNIQSPGISIVNSTVGYGTPHL